MAAEKNPIRFSNQGFKQVRRAHWSTTALVLSSAVLGGIAVALWNRKALTAFHNHQCGDETPEPASIDQEDSFY